MNPSWTDEAPTASTRYTRSGPAEIVAVLSRQRVKLTFGDSEPREASLGLPAYAPSVGDRVLAFGDSQGALWIVGLLAPSMTASLLEDAEREAAPTRVRDKRGRLLFEYDPETDRAHGTVSPDYFAKAFRQIAETLDYPTYFLFSDDFEWAIENLPSEGFDLRPIDHNGPEKDYADLHLMSRCQHHILANSTFSWWAAWLANNPAKTVLYPKKWFRTADHDPTDIFPESWLPIAQP